MSSRISYFLAIILLFVGAALRLHQITTLPPALYPDEIIEIRIAESAREGNIEVFYNLGAEEGREGLYHIALALSTSLIGKGTIGYRMLSVWSAMITLAVVYATGRRLYSPLVGLSALALLVVGFWPILLSRSVIQENLLPLLVASVLLSISISLPIYRRRRKRGDNTSAATAMGVLLGLGLYTHPVGLVIMLFALSFVLFMIRFNHQMSRRRRSYIAFAMLLMIIIGMPYLTSSLRNPELSGVSRLIADDPQLSLKTITQALGGFFISGDSNPLHNLPKRPMFDIVSSLIILSGLVVIVKDWRQSRYALLWMPILFLSPIFLFGSPSPNFIHYTAMLPILALSFGIGVKTLFENLPNTYYKWTASVGLLILFIFNVQWTTYDLFKKWPQSPELQAIENTRLGQLAHYIDMTADHIPTVICGWQFEQSPSAPQLTYAQIIELMRNNHDASVRYVNCHNALVFPEGGEGQQIIIPDATLLENTHRHIKEWLDRGTFITADNIPPDSVLSLAIPDLLANTVGEFTTTSPIRFAPEVGGGNDALINPPVYFGNNLTLLGYIQDESIVYQPGDTLSLTTYWRIEGSIPRDLRLFTHVLADPGATPPANTDIIHLNPRLLKSRDVFIQVTRIHLPESLPDGDYQISIGAYQDVPETRLSVLVDGQERGTRLFLYTIIVQAE